MEDEIVLGDERTILECKLDTADGSIFSLLYADSTVESGWERLNIFDCKDFQSQGPEE
jgi:hypothetical protein